MNKLNFYVRTALIGMVVTMSFQLAPIFTWSMFIRLFICTILIVAMTSIVLNFLEVEKL